MTSPRQCTANRLNARASTGPKSADGKVRASQNARRHGLNVPVTSDPNWIGQVEALAQGLVGPAAGDPTRLAIARAAAGAHFDAVRARHTRARHLDQVLDTLGREPAEAPQAPADVFAALDAQLGLNTKGLVAGWQAGLSPRQYSRSVGQFERQAHALLSRPAASDDASLRAAGKLSRYIRRATSARKSALRLLAYPGAMG
jgi:hypothetical protein